MKFTLLIVEDHALLRETWKSMLDVHPLLEVVAICGSGEEAIEWVSGASPRLVMMDINLKGIDGIKTTEQLKKISPAIRVLCVTGYNSTAYLRKVMAAGAHGYLTKNVSREEMIEGLMEVAAGKKFICREMKERLSNEVMDGKETKDLGSLTARQTEIIQFIKQGYSSKEIAVLLGLSIKTVEVHRYHILHKLGLKNTAALVNYIHLHGQQ